MPCPAVHRPAARRHTRPDARSTRARYGQPGQPAPGPAEVPLRLHGGSDGLDRTRGIQEKERVPTMNVAANSRLPISRMAEISFPPAGRTTQSPRDRPDADPAYQTAQARPAGLLGGFEGRGERKRASRCCEFLNSDYRISPFIEIRSRETIAAIDQNQ